MEGKKLPASHQPKYGIDANIGGIKEGLFRKGESEICTEAQATNITLCFIKWIADIPEHCSMGTVSAEWEALL